MTERNEYRVPRQMMDTFSEISALTDSFCDSYLNHEYADLSRKMAAALSRKRPSPLERGLKKSWAAGILYALGQVNFLFDKSEEPSMSTADLCERVGVSQSTASNKAREISERLKLTPFDPEWCLPSRLDANPLAWFIMVDGVICDVRAMPKEIQEEAFRLGLIPYLPEAGDA